MEFYAKNLYAGVLCFSPNLLVSRSSDYLCNAIFNFRFIYLFHHCEIVKGSISFASKKSTTNQEMSNEIYYGSTTTPLTISIRGYFIPIHLFGVWYPIVFSDFRTNVTLQILSTNIPRERELMRGDAYPR